ncbi:hypothetical protein Y032_0127g1395 [Ancylostoma ceylanicum]|uniref:Uncharacterized protein n=1 Tax=Ancylostoma ceylanicum TaxID=53326 RepID=A0A016T8C6_9BILA|nr:hypothetical protein Y032_0127g1395 [Ancylostoma ceylanicum]
MGLMASANADKDGKAAEMHAFSAAEKQNDTNESRTAAQRAGWPMGTAWASAGRIGIDPGKGSADEPPPNCSRRTAIDTEKRTHTQERIDEVINALTSVN